MAPQRRARPAKAAAKKAQRASPRKAPKRSKPAAKAVKPKAKAKASRKAPVRAKKPAAKAKPQPEHSDRLARLRAQAVARRTPHDAATPESQAEHDHHDPRLAGIDAIGPESGKVDGRMLHYGQMKNASRNQQTVNWFRRASHPKQ